MNKVLFLWIIFNTKGFFSYYTLGDDMTFSYNDIHLYYEKYGNKKRSIVLLPGWGDTKGTFYYIIHFLSMFFTVYIIDLPGFGQSSFPNKNLTIYDYADLINNFMTHLNISNPILIGHSFGGRIIITLCGHYKINIDKIILIDSAGIKPKKSLYRRLKTYLYKFLKKLKFLLPKRKRKRYLNKLIHLFGSEDYKNLNQNMRKTFINIVNEDLSYYLKDIESEVLLIWGKKDEDTPLKDGKKMNKLIKHSALIELNGSHFCYLENINLINNILYEFLKDDIDNYE